MKPSEILKAHEDGLVVEQRITNGSWAEFNVSKALYISSLSYPGVEYRIKREPRTFWVILRNDGSVVGHSGEPSEDNAREQAADLNKSTSCAKYHPYTVIKVTEDL